MREVFSLALSRVGDADIVPGDYVDLPGRGRTYAWQVEPAEKDAPTLLLLHGLGCTSYLNWFPAVPALAGKFRLVAMDMRGHGRGMALKSRIRLADCADDAVALADVLGIERFVAVGYSLGGPIAQLVWHRHRDRVSGLVLAATSRNFGGSLQERIWYRMTPVLSTGIRLGSRVLGDEPPPPPAVAEAQLTDDARLPRWAMAEMHKVSPQVTLQAMNAMGRFSSHEWIGGVHVPTSVVITTKDRLISPSRQIKLARAIPDATLHPCAAGHAACVLSHRRFVPALAEACDSVASQLAPHPPTVQKEPAWND